MRVLSRFVAFVWVIFLTMSPVSAYTANEVKAATDAATHRLDLQLELPAAEPDDNWFSHLRIPPEFLLLALLVGLGVVAYQFKDMIPIWRLGQSRNWVGVAASETHPGEPEAGTAVVAADELARQGRFVDAMHLLLLQSLTAIRERLGEPFADSLTSREILRGTRLSEAGKTSLRDIVMRVERSYFGTHPAERVDYEACRTRFDELARALPGESAA